MNPGRFKNGFVYLLILVAAVALLYSLFTPSQKPQEIDISEVAKQAQDGLIREIRVKDDVIKVVYKNPDVPEATSRKEPGISAIQTLKDLGVSQEQLAKITFKMEPPSDVSNWIAILGSFVPMVLVFALFYFLMRQAQGTNNQALSFGKSRARLFTGDKPTVTFDDVAGADEAKQELREVVEFLKEPQKFIALGARIPKGVLLVGAPGTGKTLMAKAVSGEAGVPFFSISGSEFVEMFVGVGASRVRDLFDQAKKHAPCIVFVDEIDAVGRQRGAGLGGSHDEREQTLNQILVEMDGFDTDTNVIIMAATNRPDILDPALLRPGRFDRRVVMDPPDLKGRRGILEVHVRGKPLAPDVDLDALAKDTPGFVGADIENMVNEAAILAARRNKKRISMAEFEEAIEKVLMGPERKSRLLSPEDKRITAYHEAGHAVVGRSLPNCDPVRKLTIIPRGLALGLTATRPEGDRYIRTKSKFLDDMAFMLGGRAAEELIFNEVTTGAQNDMEQATQLARQMVTRYGMSERLGPMVWGQKEELVFLGREIGEQRDYSEKVAQEIDEEVRRIINTAYERAKEVLLVNKERLIAIAEALMEKETLDEKEFEAFFQTEPAPAG